MAKKEMKKLLLIPVVLLLLQGCVPLIVAGVAATAGSGYLRYKGMDREADALDGLREKVRDEIREAESTTEDR